MNDGYHKFEGSSKSGVKYTNLSFIRFSNYPPKKTIFLPNTSKDSRDTITSLNPGNLKFYGLPVGAVSHKTTQPFHGYRFTQFLVSSV